MEEKLNRLLKNCKAFLQLHQKQTQKSKAIDEEQQARYVAIKKLYTALLETNKKNEENSTPPINPVAEFNDLYNKNFAYLHKFTAVAQNSIKHILHYQQLVQKMATLYQAIPQQTLERQAQILGQRKKDMDKWQQAFEEMLQSKENQQTLEKRFLELLDLANAALKDKGIAALAIHSDTDTHTA